MKQFMFHLTTEHRDFHGVVWGKDSEHARRRIEQEFGRETCQQIQLKEMSDLQLQYCEVEVSITP